MPDIPGNRWERLGKESLSSALIGGIASPEQFGFEGLRHVFVIVGAIQAAIPAAIASLEQVFRREYHEAPLVEVEVDTLNQRLHPLKDFSVPHPVPYPPVFPVR